MEEEVPLSKDGDVSMQRGSEDMETISLIFSNFCFSFSLSNFVFSFILSSLTC